MRKVLSIAGAVVLASAALITPASAQTGGTGGGQTPNQSPGTTTDTTSGGGQGTSQGAGGGGAGQQGGTQSGQGTGSSGATGSGGAGSGSQSGSGGQMGGGSMAGGPMQATGSCGMSAGAYGMTDVNSGDVNNAGETVPALFYRVDYSGLPAPTTVGVIVRYNNELESQIAVQPFTAQSSGGSQEGAIRANISPEAQGFANSIDAGRRGRSDGPPSGGNAEHGNPSGTRVAKGGLQGSGTQGGLLPGEYVFHVYTGEIRDMPETVKDGPAGPRFFADPKGYLGMFSCGVSTEEGSGPG